jgi:putative MATE family efflux protein
MTLCNFIASILRSHGDSRTPTVALGVTGALNVLLNVIFVRAAGMNVAGVALATLASNVICALWLIFILLRHDGEIKLVIKELKIDFAVLRKILYIGVPSGVQSMVFQFANLYLQSAINSLGTVSMAACAASRNIESMIYNVLQSFGYACSTFVGQNHGANNDRRCGMTIKRCLILDYVFTSSVCGIIILFRYQIMGLFNSDPEVIEQSCIRLLLLFLSYAFSVSYEICSGYMRGFGRPLSPTIISLICICGIRFFWVAVIFPSHRDFTSLMAVFPISIGVTSLVIALWTFVFAKKRKRSQNADLPNCT